MNVWGWEKNSIHIFYFLNKINVSFIFNMFYFQTEGIMIDCATSLWCWNVEAFKHEIFKFKKFEKILRNEPVIYALILNNKNEDITALIIFYKIIDYTDVFFKENAEKLSEYEKDNHAIELNEQDSSFKSLYNLLSLELKIL